MIMLADIARQYQQHLIHQYQHKFKAVHLQALKALIQCRTPELGEMQYQCTPCHQQHTFCHSCGHRSCPQCQHRSNSQWLARQQQKLLPVDYFMVTFTLPYELRPFVWSHQRWAYATLFETAVATLNTFAKNDKHLKGNLGMTAVLHTHSRRLDFHPHIHIIIPAGSFNSTGSCWHTKITNYLFNEFALAKVFRARFLQSIQQAGFFVPKGLPKKWVVQCQPVGHGEPALKYLARYLYRGVINENNIIKYEQGEVTFRYQDSKTKSWKVRTETAVDFLWLVLQHVLPKGFRRARDYGFLHGLAKKTLQRIQLLLKVAISPLAKIKRKEHLCPCCKNPMDFILFFKRPKKLIRNTT